MTGSAPEPDGKGADRETGSLPIGFRTRARRLYRIRRQQLMEVPLVALHKRFGTEAVEVAEFHQGARVEGPDYTLEVSFAGKYRMFGALIDLQWVGLRGTVAPEDERFEYRFDKKSFAVKKGSDAALARQLGDTRTIELAGRSELKSLNVTHGSEGRRVIITPLPGTITAVYFPPLPPYSVPLKAHEARDHIELALHLLGA